MRHLWSLIAGLVIAPLTWVLLAYANGGIAVATAMSDRDRLIVPMVIVAVAALLVGSIASLRISPLGPLVGGLILISVSVLGIAFPVGLSDALPDLPKIQDFRTAALLEPVLNGELLLVGVILIFAVFSAGRWKTWPTPVLHPTVGPVNPMVDTGRIEAIKSWSPGDEATTTSTPAFYTPEAPTNPIVPEPRHAEKSDTDGASPWAAPPTGR